MKRSNGQNKSAENQSTQTGLMNIFQNQFNPEFPVNLNEDMSPGYGIVFKRIDSMTMEKVWEERDFFMGESKININNFFSIIDEPILKAIRNDKSLFDARGHLINEKCEYALYQSSLTKGTSDATRHYYDLVQVSSLSQILAFVYDCCEYNKLWFKWFLSGRKDRNLDLGYCYLLDENDEKCLYVISREFFKGKLGHLHCTKVPRGYKKGRYFLVRLRNFIFGT